MWSSTVRLIEMLSLILSPASNASALFGVFQARRVGTLTLFTYHADSYTPDRKILREYRCGGGLKIGLLCTYPELWGGRKQGSAT